MEIVEKVERQVENCIREYNLLKKSDKVVVALSGGKDSTSIAYILKKMGYDVHGLMIDLYLGSWSDKHKDNVKKFCLEFDIPLTFIDMRKELGSGICFIKSVLKEQKNLSGCTVCGVIKKWLLNRWARKMKADKLVTGHNLDDEAQNVMMNFLKGNIMLGVNSGPATGNLNVSGFVQRIKPLFFVAEDDIRKYSEAKGFDILYDKCPCSFATYRADTREFLYKISDEEKLKIVEGFQKEVLKLRKNHFKELKSCENCGEPASGKLCNACKIFESINFKPSKTRNISCGIE